MPQHVLDAGLQRRGRARTSRARALHVQVDDAILEILEDDVAAIHRDGGTHPGFKQFLDLRHDLVVFLAAFRRVRILARLGEDDRPPGREMLHDRGQDRRLQLRPVAVAVLCDGDEIRGEKNAGHFRQGEQPLGKRRSRRRARIGKIRRSRFHHSAAGQELQRGRIRRLLGLNEHRGLRSGLKKKRTS